jgi:hypothetical protein
MRSTFDARKTLIGAPPDAMLERFCIMENVAGQRAILPCGWNHEDERRRMLATTESLNDERDG